MPMHGHTENLNLHSWDYNTFPTEEKPQNLY